MRPIIILATLLLVSGCSTTRPGADVNVLDQDTGNHAVFATTECTIKNPNGTCDKKTCKKDADGDCMGLAAGCLKYGNSYSGTKNEGTCTRAPTDHTN